MKLGILGGTFNPPHIGHLILAQEAQEQLKLDKVFFVPANSPPHKDNDCLGSRLRLKMVQLATEGNSKFEVLDVEVKRKGVSYTVDTVKELKEIHPEDDFYLIIGSDLANNFARWKEPDKIKEMVSVAAAERKGALLLDNNDFFRVKVTQVGLSSSMIRQRIREKKSIKYLVPEKVEKFIRENNLYRDKS